MVLTPVLIVGLLCIQGGDGIKVNRPPTITCPESITASLKDGRSTVAVTWSDLRAYDPEDGTIPVVLDALSPKNGSQLGRGVHFIKYRAYDKKKSVAECAFAVHVDVVKCPPLVIDNGQNTCVLGAIKGQMCKTYCHEGFETPRASEVKCGPNGTYPEIPKCERMNYYRQICDHIAASPAKDFVRNIDKSLADLLSFLRSRYIPNYKTFNYLRKELCINEKAESKGPCIYLRRYDMFQRLKVDLQQITVNPARTNDQVSNFHQYTYRRVLLTHPEISSFCKKQVFLDQLYIYFPDFLRFPQSAYTNTLRNIVSAMTKVKTSNLREDANKVCSKRYRDPKCLLRDVIGTIDRAGNLFRILDNPGKNTKEDMTWYKYGATFSSVIMKWKYEKAVTAIQPVATSHHMDCVTEIIRAIAKYIDEGEDNKIIDLMSLFPEFETDKICNTGTMCLFWRVVDQSHVYVKSRKKKGDKTVDVRMINIQLDKKEFLKQKQMERILQLLVDQSYNLITVAEELKREFKHVVNKRFSELKNYFKKVHKFSAAVAKADMIVMHQLTNLTKSSKDIAKDIDINLGVLVSMVWTAAIGEVVEKTVKLAMATAESANPVDPSPSEALDAASELANAIAKLAKAVTLAGALGSAVHFTKDLKDKFAQNKEFIKVMNNVKKTILDETTNSPNFRANKNKFLEKYNDYTPAVTKPEITELEVYLDNVVDVGCGLLESMEGITASTVKVLDAASGTCPRSKVLINKMVSTLEEIYDKQFEFINVILANVKAQVGLEAAEGMLQGYDDLAKSKEVNQNVLQNLKQTAGMSYIVYRIMVIQVIRMYCDELEYKNAGVRPDVCRDARTDISTLLAYTDNPCQTTRYHYEPITNFKKWRKDKSFFNIPALYSGNPTTFKIPDTKWLVKYGWINRLDANSVLYVQSFEVYLPSEVSEPRLVRVEVEAVGENELVPGGTRYKLLPNRPMVYEYQVSYDGHCRQSSNIIVNPYTTCPSRKLGDMCPYSGQVSGYRISRGIYPSLFSTFSIRVNGYEDIVPPDPSTALPIQVAIKTCIVPRPDLKISLPSKKTKQKKGGKPVKKKCCGTGRYWDNISRNCQSCPDKSVSALDGYYCEKVKPPVVVKPAKIYPTPSKPSS